MRTLDDYIAIAEAWRSTTPVDVMSDEEIIHHTVLIARREWAAADASKLAVGLRKVYGVDNSTFCDRKGWE